MKESDASFDIDVGYQSVIAVIILCIEKHFHSGILKLIEGNFHQGTKLHATSFTLVCLT